MTSNEDFWPLRREGNASAAARSNRKRDTVRVGVNLPHGLQVKLDLPGPAARDLIKVLTAALADLDGGDR